MINQSKSALVFHPVMSVYSGGEILCLYVCKALQELGFQVQLVCDQYDPVEARKRWGLNASAIMKECIWIPWKIAKPIIKFGRRFQLPILQRTFYRNMTSFPNTELVFGTQQVFEGESDGSRFAIFYDKRTLALLDDSVRENTVFVPITHLLRSQLEQEGFRHSDVVYPPCQELFKPGKKREMIVQVTRLNPGKNLEEFVEIARHLPEYDFALVYTVPEFERRVFPEYEKKFKSGNIPPNLQLVKELILNVPEYMEQSKVYLYTGWEPGTTTSLGQAMLAGCLPVVSPGGAAEMVETLGHGYSYKNIEDAVDKVRLAMESDLSPFNIASDAKIFAPDVFVDNIKKIVS